MSDSGAYRSPRTCAQLVAKLLVDTRHFAPSWLGEEGKEVIPLATPARIDNGLALRLAASGTQRTVGYAVAGRLGPEHADELLEHVRLTPDELRSFPWQDTDFLLALFDFSGALLVTTDGYSLLAGRMDFLHASVGEGLDQARATFARQARKLAATKPAMVQVSADLGPRRRVWSSPTEVDSDSAVAQQLSLMESFASGTVGPAQFSQGWLRARRRQLDDGERLRDEFRTILGEIFYALDEYVADPNLRKPGDMSDEALAATVRKALNALNALDN